LHVGFQGIFSADLINRSGEVINSWKFHNVITDSLMDGIGSGSYGVAGPAASTTLSRLRAGTGTTPPSGSDISLQTPIGNYVTANGGFVDEVGFVSGSSPSGSYHYLIRT